MNTARVEPTVCSGERIAGSAAIAAIASGASLLQIDPDRSTVAPFLLSSRAGFAYDDRIGFNVVEDDSSPSAHFGACADPHAINHGRSGPNGGTRLNDRTRPASTAPGPTWTPSPDPALMVDACTRIDDRLTPNGDANSYSKREQESEFPGRCFASEATNAVGCLVERGLRPCCSR